MNIPRDIIRDLLPAYWSGEASAATRQAVDAAFADDPAFAADAARDAVALRRLGAIDAPTPETIGERETLARVRRTLRRQRVVFAIALTFTFNALTLGFGFDVRDGHVSVRWLPIPGQRTIVLTMLVLALLLWAVYFRIAQRVRSRILG